MLEVRAERKDKNRFSHTFCDQAPNIPSQEPGSSRKDIWITSKAWNSHHSPEYVRKALNQTLKILHTDYLDLYLIQWPANFAVIPDHVSPTGVSLEPSQNGTILLDRELSLVDTWRAFIEPQKQGQEARVKLSLTEQIEAQLLLNQEEQRDYCKKKGVHIMAYMPFGGDASRAGNQVLGSPVVRNIAKKTEKQAGQVLVSCCQALTALGKAPVRFGGIPCTLNPEWKAIELNDQKLSDRQGGTAKSPAPGAWGIQFPLDDPQRLRRIVPQPLTIAQLLLPRGGLTVIRAE
ncbi:hypothetical protein N7532_010105 [Penicillium argentinense]|uniref:NADP-dependent oxidoreductase domain-containing protein n=1 Tax=Penicillium argentinense TaxID=1131581 RepID=A0A9W9JXB8_9EURO|nr:uncharacterized protein N7532_010105 [Penicillium argentinense]KAJ5085334.1 hypothetical protein N7532_010105 [Penicillium argentinense]